MSEEARRKINEALSANERARIVELFTSRNRRLNGAHYDDLLDMADQADAYCGRTDVFFMAHPGWPAGAGYAAVAICAQGLELTVERMTDLLTRAGLLPWFSAMDFSVPQPAPGKPAPAVPEKKILWKQQVTPRIAVGVSEDHLVILINGGDVEEQVPDVDMLKAAADNCMAFIAFRKRVMDEWPGQPDRVQEITDNAWPMSD